jgi:acyl-CoA hydrolase
MGSNGNDDERAQLQAALASLTLRLDSLEKEVATYRSEGRGTPTRILPSPRRRGDATVTIPANLGTLEIPMAATRVVTAQMVGVPDVNGLGICVGGVVLSWIDVCAGLAAKTLARGPCVTASVDAVQFLRPCRQGSVVIVAAMVNRTFKSSMEVGVRVEEECPLSGARHHCCSAYMTFVAVSPGGGRRDLPRVSPGASRRLREIHNDAERRREGRLERRQRLRDDPAASAAEAACRLLPVTHREGTPTLPPALKVRTGTASREGSAHGAPPPPLHRVAIPPSLTTAHATHIIMPQHANSIDITFGGQILRWVEQAAFIVATRLSRGAAAVLTAAMDEVTFLRPTRVGDTVYLEAQATAVFGSSMEVMISVWGEVPEEGTPFHCGDAYATLVAVGLVGEPVEIPFEIVPRSGEEKMRYRGAVARREGRLRLREALLRDRAKRPSLDEEVLTRQPPADGLAAVVGAIGIGDGEEEEESEQMPSALVQALAEA